MWPIWPADFRDRLGIVAAAGFLQQAEAQARQGAGQGAARGEAHLSMCYRAYLCAWMPDCFLDNRQMPVPQDAGIVWNNRAVVNHLRRPLLRTAGSFVLVRGRAQASVLRSPNWA
jgi:hypothetical protein